MFRKGKMHERAGQLRADSLGIGDGRRKTYILVDGRSLPGASAAEDLQGRGEVVLRAARGSARTMNNGQQPTATDVDKQRR
jgi:hypothetical protein